MFGAETGDSLNQEGEATEFEYQIIPKPERNFPPSSWSLFEEGASKPAASAEVENHQESSQDPAFSAAAAVDNQDPTEYKVVI